MKTAAFMTFLLGLAALFALGPRPAEGIECFACGIDADEKWAKELGIYRGMFSNVRTRNVSMRQKTNLELIAGPCDGVGGKDRCSKSSFCAKTWTQDGDISKGCWIPESYLRDVLPPAGTCDPDRRICSCDTDFCSNGRAKGPVTVTVLGLAFLSVILPRL